MPGPGAAQLMALGPSGIEAFLKTFTDWNFRTPLSPDDYFWRDETLVATITTSATTGQVTYRGPANFNGLIWEVRGSLAFNAATTETLSITGSGGTTGIGNADVDARVLLKAMNYRLDLKNVDREQKIFGTAAKPLSDLLRDPLKCDPPTTLPEGEALQLDIASEDTTAAIMGGSTDVGVSVLMLFVRTRP